MGVAIIGGGIAGLSAAYALHRFGIPFTLFEAAPELGGKVQTVTQSGFLVELGPNALQRSSPRLEMLLDELGLINDVQPAAPAARNRYIVRNGRPVALPNSALTFFTSKAISWKARAALLAEPFQGPSLQADTTVAEFVTNRLGNEWLDYAVDPFVSGIFAGDPARLSLLHGFPRLYERQSYNGSIIRGAFRKSSSPHSSVPRRRTFSFTAGMQALPKAIFESMTSGPAASFSLQTRVTQLERNQGGWNVWTDKEDEPRSFDGVICTTPLHAMPQLPGLNDEKATLLRDVSHPHVNVFALGYKREQVNHPLDGFGMLIPACETGFDMLGVIFSSTLFPGRAPDGCVLLTILAGGRRRPDLSDLSQNQLQERIERDLEDLLGVQGSPIFATSHRWSKAIPQYELGYGEVKEALDELESANPGLSFAGNFRQGIALVDALESGWDAAEGVMRFLAP